MRPLSQFWVFGNSQQLFRHLTRIFAWVFHHKSNQQCLTSQVAKWAYNTADKRILTNPTIEARPKNEGLGSWSKIGWKKLKLRLGRAYIFRIQVTCKEGNLCGVEALASWKTNPAKPREIRRIFQFLFFKSFRHTSGFRIFVHCRWMGSPLLEPAPKSHAWRNLQMIHLHFSSALDFLFRVIFFTIYYGKSLWNHHLR